MWMQTRFGWWEGFEKVSNASSHQKLELLLGEGTLTATPNPHCLSLQAWGQIIHYFLGSFLFSFHLVPGSSWPLQRSLCLWTHSYFSVLEPGLPPFLPSLGYSIFPKCTFSLVSQLGLFRPPPNPEGFAPYKGARI